jgi:hypothetical protein
MNTELWIEAAMVYFKVILWIFPEEFWEGNFSWITRFLAKNKMEDLGISYFLKRLVLRVN